MEPSGNALGTLLFEPGTPGREDFSLRFFLWRTRAFPLDTVRLLLRIVTPRAGASLKRLPGPVYRTLRALARAVRAFYKALRAVGRSAASQR